MGLIQALGQGQGYLKAGLLGFPKSGKTYTACLLACATKKLFGFGGPIAMVDSENGSEYVAPLVEKLTGQQLVGVRTRSFDDLVKMGIECLQSKVSVLIVDSVTHFWRELCDAFLKTVNEKRKRRGLGPRTQFEFQDWGPLKAQWNDRWTSFYLNSALHIIICGRAGFEYDYNVDAETGKRELQKTGVKMKTESEFGFEPSLLVEMERDYVAGDSARITRYATVIGDRFGVIDGLRGRFDTIRDKKGQPDDEAHLDRILDFFRPHLTRLRPGAHSTVDTEVRTQIDVDEDGNADYRRRKREQTILCEEIHGLMEKKHPSMSAKDKAARSALREEFFGTCSGTKIATFSPECLRKGLERMRAKLERPTQEPPAAAAAGPEDDPFNPKPKYDPEANRLPPPRREPEGGYISKDDSPTPAEIARAGQEEMLQALRDAGQNVDGLVSPEGAMLDRLVADNRKLTALCKKLEK